MTFPFYNSSKGFYFFTYFYRFTPIKFYYIILLIEIDDIHKKNQTIRLIMRKSVKIWLQ